MKYIKKYNQINESISNSELEIRITNILNDRSYTREIKKILSYLPDRLKNILANFLKRNSLIDLNKYNFFDKVNRFIKRGKDISEIEEIVEESKNESISVAWTIFSVGGILILIYLIIKVFGYKHEYDHSGHLKSVDGETHALILFIPVMFICACTILFIDTNNKIVRENPGIIFIRNFNHDGEVKTVKVFKEENGDYKAIVE